MKQRITARQICSLYSKINLMLRALYVDFNSYFASMSSSCGLELRGRPVAW